MDFCTVKKAVVLACCRPVSFLSYFRQWFLFSLTHFLWPVIGSKNVSLGRNVRIQRLKCVICAGEDASIKIGDHSILYEDARVHACEKGRIEIGEMSILGPVKIAARQKIIIGKRFLSSWNVFIQDFDPHPVDQQLRARQVSSVVKNFIPCYGPRPEALDLKTAEWSFPSEEIVIGDDVWVGAGATILKGARIGEGCIIAASAVVLKGDYPARSIIAGNPARIVKQLAAAAVISQVETLKSPCQPPSLSS